MTTGATSRGALLLFEGCDRSGKSTQTENLVASLKTKGYPTELLKFPDRTTLIGKVINSYLTNGIELNDETIHLLFSANRWEAVYRIRKLLLSGTTLVLDRYAYSGAAFTAAKGHRDLNWCKQPDVGLPKPDVVFFLDLPPEAAINRGGYGDERYEKKVFQDKVREQYLLLKDDSWIIIDASGTVEKVGEKLEELAEKVVKSVGNREIGTLWTESETEIKQKHRACPEGVCRNGGLMNSGAEGDVVNGWHLSR